MMSTAMLDYDDFDLDTATADRFTLQEAVAKAGEMRDSEPDRFVRIKKVGTDEFMLVKLSAREVYAEWTDRMRQRLAKFSRRSVSR